MDWDPEFAEASPLLEALRSEARALKGFCDWPDRTALQAIVRERRVTTAAGEPVRLVPPSGEPYEAQLYARGELQVRERNWHDLFNVLAWLTYPQAKAALNRRHVLAAEAETAGRGRVRDALTLFDESGVIVTSTEPSLLDDLREFRWKRLFRERREDVLRCMRFAVFGHALAEKALTPYVGMTGHAILLREPGGDAALAGYLRDPATFCSPRDLAPLPVLGVPGWWRDNERADFYDNTDYFRPNRKRGQTPITGG